MGRRNGKDAMNPLRSLMPLGLVLVLSLAAFDASAASPPASVPTWSVGQAVGYGTSLDLTSLVDTYILNKIRSNPTAFNITSINALNFTGSFDSWSYDQVTQKTDTYYVLSSRSAEGIKFHFNVNATMNNLPVPGTYAGTRSAYGVCLPPTIPAAARTVAVTVDASALTTTSGTTRQQVTNLAYMTETLNATVQASVVVSAYNLPSSSTNQTTCVKTVTYESPSFTLTVDTHNQLRMLFQPAWDFFNFPISDNKTWWANTTATLGATLSGTINVQGLSSQDQKAFFDNLTKTFQSAGLAVTGLDHFPIDLAKITISAGLTNIVENGVVQDYPTPLRQSFRAISSAQTLSDGSIHPVYLITSSQYQCPPAGGTLSLPVDYAAVYAPDFPAQNAGMIVGYQLLVCAGTMNLPGFELKNTAPSDAQNKIGQTESNYNPFPPAPSNAIVDFFVAAPYWGFLIFAVVVVAAVAFLFVRRRGRRMAPSMPPQAPPPGTP